MHPLVPKTSPLPDGLAQSPDRLKVELKCTSVELFCRTWHVWLQWGCSICFQQLPNPLLPRKMVVSEGLDAMLQCEIEDIDEAILSQVVDGQLDVFDAVSP